MHLAFSSFILKAQFPFDPLNGKRAFFEDFFEIKHSAFVMALSYIYEYVRKLIKRMRAQKQTVTKMSFLKKHLRARISVVYM